MIIKSIDLYQGNKNKGCKKWNQKIIAKELTEAKVSAELATGIAEEAKSKAESASANSRLNRFMEF